MEMLACVPRRMNKCVFLNYLCIHFHFPSKIDWSIMVTILKVYNCACQVTKVGSFLLLSPELEKPSAELFLLSSAGPVATGPN